MSLCSKFRGAQPKHSSGLLFTYPSRETKSVSKLHKWPAKPDLPPTYLSKSAVASYAQGARADSPNQRRGSQEKLQDIYPGIRLLCSCKAWMETRVVMLLRQVGPIMKYFWTLHLQLRLGTTENAPNVNFSLAPRSWQL